jgi:hypothetical protein
VIRSNRFPSSSYAAPQESKDDRVYIFANVPNDTRFRLAWQLPKTIFLGGFRHYVPASGGKKSTGLPSAPANVCSEACW